MRQEAKGRVNGAVKASRRSGDNGMVKRITAVPLILVSTLLLAIGVAIPASAHTQLIGVDPGEGAAVAAGTAVTLTFSGELLAIGAEATVTDEAGEAATLEVTFPTASSAQILLPSMAGGKVTLAWRVVSGDGHPVEGALTYVADAPVQTSQPLASADPGPTASAGATTSPAGTASPTEVSPSAAPVAEANDSSRLTSVALWVAIFGGVFVSSMAIVAAKRRR